MNTLLARARLYFKRHGVLPLHLHAALEAQGYTNIEELVAARDDQLQFEPDYGTQEFRVLPLRLKSE